MKNIEQYDVIVIGGSYAGLSAAMALGRSLRHVLIIDSGLPCNRQTPHSHNFITQDGEKPSVIAEKARAQVLKYSTVRFMEDLAVSGKKTGAGFTITTQTNQEFDTRKLIFATGIKDIMPPIKGFAECWGITVVHCPYCHGYELRTKKTAIIANKERAFHLASLVNNLTDNITVFTSSKDDFSEDELLKLQKHHIKISEKEVIEVEHDNGQIRNVIFKDGNKEDFESIYAGIPFAQHCDIPVSLGCGLTEQGFIEVNAFQKTTVEGIYACGDNCSMMRAVATSVYTGNLAGAMVNRELTEEMF